MALTDEENKEFDEVGIVIGGFIGALLAWLAIYLIGGEWPFGTKSEMIMRGLAFAAAWSLRLIITDDDEGVPKGFAYGWTVIFLLFFLWKLVVWLFLPQPRPF